MIARTSAALAAVVGVLCCSSVPAWSQSYPPPNRAEGARDKAPGRDPHIDCSRAPNPANCAAQRREFRAQLIKAQDACQNRRGEDHHACMIQTMCRQERNPEQCESIARRRAEFRREVGEACAGRVGDDLRNCVVARLGYAPWRPPAGTDGDD